MANEQNRNPGNTPESDISKAQSQQQPPQQASQQQGETGQQSGQFETRGDAALTGDQAATGQARADAGPDEGLQGETTTRQRTDIEGASLGSKERGNADSGFVGSQGGEDSSSELVKGQEFKKDGQGVPEGK